MLTEHEILSYLIIYIFDWVQASPKLFVIQISVKSVHLKTIGLYGQNFIAVSLTFPVPVTLMLKDIGLTAHCAQPA